MISMLRVLSKEVVYNQFTEHTDHFGSLPYVFLSTKSMRPVSSCPPVLSHPILTSAAAMRLWSAVPSLDVSNPSDLATAQTVVFPDVTAVVSDFKKAAIAVSQASSSYRASCWGLMYCRSNSLSGCHGFPAR